jgi:DNA (cytosine-5)-methyltransferase 1
MWPTPNASDVQRGPQDPEKRRQGGHQVKLSDAVKAKMWPTPTCMAGAMYLETNALERKSMSLASAVHHWITPMARDYKGHTNNPETRGYGGTLPDQVLERSGGGQLNPTWVEWLMGWPLGWTDLSASATDRFQQWRRSHGAS